MWGHLCTELSNLYNFNVGFSTHKSEILIHLSQWQYWWWFWFSFFWTFYFFVILRVIKHRVFKMNLKINTSFRSRGKWGDYLVTLIPLSWCLNILLNSNFILRMIEWQAEAGSLIIRIHGKQWYWVYKYDLQNVDSVFNSSKNLGHAKWASFKFSGNTMFNNYINQTENKLALLSQNEYWTDAMLRDFNKTSTYSLTTNAPRTINNLTIKVYPVQNYNSLVTDQFLLTESVKQQLIIKLGDKYNQKNTTQARWKNPFNTQKQVKLKKNIQFNFVSETQKQEYINKMGPFMHKSLYAPGKNRSSSLFGIPHKRSIKFTDFIEKNYKLKNKKFMQLSSKNSFLKFKPSLDSFFFKEHSIFKYISMFNIKTKGFELCRFTPKKNINPFKTSKAVLNYINALNKKTKKTHKIYTIVEKTWNEDHKLQYKFFPSVKIKKPKNTTINYYENNNVDDAWEVYSNVKLFNTNQPIRVVQTPIQLSNLKNLYKLFSWRILENTSSISDKPEENIDFLVIKQKRYKRKQGFKHLNVTTKSVNATTNRFLKNNLIFTQIAKTGTQEAFNFYSAVKLNRVKAETFSINLARRLLRTTRTLVLPAYTNISIIANSYDVVHSWFIPGLGIKMDCVPGKSTHHSLYIDNVGLYYGQCAEICGRYHHHMPIRICAIPFDHFIVWWVSKGLPKLLKTRYKPKHINTTMLFKYTW